MVKLEDSFGYSRTLSFIVSSDQNKGTAKIKDIQVVD